MGLAAVLSSLFDRVLCQTYMVVQWLQLLPRCPLGDPRSKSTFVWEAETRWDSTLLAQQGRMADVRKSSPQEGRWHTTVWIWHSIFCGNGWNRYLCQCLSIQVHIVVECSQNAPCTEWIPSVHGMNPIWTKKEKHREKWFCRFIPIQRFGESAARVWTRLLWVRSQPNLMDHKRGN